MDQKIKRLFEKLHSSVRLAKDLAPEQRELIEGELFQLEDAVAQQKLTYEAAVVKAGPRTFRGPFWTEPAGQDILRRAMAADPMRTEHDLIALGARDTLTLIGAQHQAELFREVLPVEEAAE